MDIVVQQWVLLDIGGYWRLLLAIVGYCRSTQDNGNRWFLMELVPSFSSVLQWRPSGSSGSQHSMGMWFTLRPWWLGQRVNLNSLQAITTKPPQHSFTSRHHLSRRCHVYSLHSLLDRSTPASRKNTSRSTMRKDHWLLLSAINIRWITSLFSMVSTVEIQWKWVEINVYYCHFHWFSLESPILIVNCHQRWLEYIPW